MDCVFLQHEYPAVRISRSRAGRPNDNRLVEEKNGSVVRYYLGDWRFDTVTQTRFLNTVYEKIDRYRNLFLSVMKEIAKQWMPPTDDHQGYVERQHDTARPPLTRLCELLGTEHSQCQTLYAQYARSNPLELIHTIYADLDHLFAYPNATAGQIEDVFETLADPDRFPDMAAPQTAVGTVGKPNSGLPTVPTAATPTEHLSTYRKELA